MQSASSIIACASEGIPALNADCADFPTDSKYSAVRCFLVVDRGAAAVSGSPLITAFAAAFAVASAFAECTKFDAHKTAQTIPILRIVLCSQNAPIFQDKIRPICALIS